MRVSEKKKKKKNTENSECLGRQALPVNKHCTSRLPVITAELLGHWWGWSKPDSGQNVCFYFGSGSDLTIGSFTPLLKNRNKIFSFIICFCIVFPHLNRQTSRRTVFLKRSNEFTVLSSQRMSYANK